MKLFYDLHYLPMTRIIFPLDSSPLLDSFCPVSFAPPPPPPWKLLNDLHPYHFSPAFIPPPPFNFAPNIILLPWKLFNDLHYLPMSHIIPPTLDSFCPHIILPPGNCLMINTIYTIYPCPISFSPWIHFAPVSFCPHGKKLFNDLHYLHMSRIILPPGFILAPFSTKAYDRRASGDCGTSGWLYSRFWFSSLQNSTLC